MKRFNWFYLLLILLVLLSLSSCSGFSTETAASIPVDVEPDSIAQVTRTPLPTASPTPKTNPSPTPTREQVNGICSPLKDIELRDLHSITSQSFTPPAPYKDDGHPAADLAFFTFKEMPSMIGHPVQSIFPGTVVQVLADRYPYGNTILIETPLDGISADLINILVLPTPIPQENLDLVQPCISDPLFKDIPPLEMSDSSKSLYVLYAHLLEEPVLKIGEEVFCGQKIGFVGNTGNSAAEHLHLETRIGPSGAAFGSLAMYTPDATIEERYSYCIWTSSGRFQPFNPVTLWEQEP